MRTKISLLTILLVPLMMVGQNSFHVFPKSHKNAGTANGNGSLTNPMDLQTALNATGTIKAGDIVLIHEGVYDGKFISTIEGKPGKPIVVKPYKNAKVILNGNVASKEMGILVVKGGNVIFKDLEITFLGKFSRKKGENNFKPTNGIYHISGEDCEFINLKIHNNPGSGIGSWKHTGGTKIVGCLIFNNGYFTSVRGSGVGIYVQNISDKVRLIKDNFIFNNYYKGVEVWSASSGSKKAYIKNITLDNNVIFNNGMPGGRHVDNVIVASGDNDGVNVPKNIKVNNNILYHNTNFRDGSNYHDGASLTLGYGGAAITGTEVHNNVIVGKNNGMRILNTKAMSFKNNVVYSGYVVMYKDVLKNLNNRNWKMSDNQFHTRSSNLFRIEKHGDYNIDKWKRKFGIAAGKWNKLKEISLPSELKKIKIKSDTPAYRLAVFSISDKSVNIDFSKENIPLSTNYSVKDITGSKVIYEGKLDESGIVSFPIKDTHGTKRFLSVYEIEFDSKALPKTSKKKPKTFFGKLFGWLF